MEYDLSQKDRGLARKEKDIKDLNTSLGCRDKRIKDFEIGEKILINQITNWQAWSNLFRHHYGKIAIIAGGSLITGGIAGIILYKKMKAKNNKKKKIKKANICEFNSVLKSTFNAMNSSCNNIHQTLMFHLDNQKKKLLLEHLNIKKSIGERKKITNEIIQETESSYKDFKSEVQETSIIGHQNKTNISTLIDAQICLLSGDKKKKKGKITIAVNSIPVITKASKKLLVDGLKKINKVLKQSKKGKKQPKRALETEMLFLTYNEINNLINSITKYDKLIESQFENLKRKVNSLVEGTGSQKIVTCPPKIWKPEVHQYHRMFSSIVESCGLPKEIVKVISGFDYPFRKNTDFKSIKSESDRYKKETKEKSKTKQFIGKRLEDSKTFVYGGLKELGQKMFSGNNNETSIEIKEENN